MDHLNTAKCKDLRSVVQYSNVWYEGATKLTTKKSNLRFSFYQPYIKYCISILKIWDYSEKGYL